MRPTLARFAGWLRKLARSIVIALLTLIFLFLLLFIFRAPLLTKVGNFLVVSDSLAKADVIYLMGGGLDTRPMRAAQLYRAGYAQRVAIPWGEIGMAERLGVRPNIAVETAMVLQRLGVPRSAIVLLKVPGGSRSTLDDANIFARYARKNQIRSVIAVTSEFHTRRSRWALRKMLRKQDIDLRMAPADDPRYDVDDWWQHEAGMLDNVTEFIKFVHNFTHLKRW